MKLNKFLWGASTSAFQVEGGYELGGKGIATTDIRKIPKEIADTKIASDHYHHWKEDIHLMAELGINLYRFSFNWSRIMPDGKHVNLEGINFYKQIIEECLKYNIVPFPTLYHFEMPQALVDLYGGWKSRECIEDFYKYAEVCFSYFGDKVNMWATINEMMVVTAATELNGNIHAKGKQIKKDMYQMSYHMSIAEKKVISLFRKMIPNGQIGHVCAMQVVYPFSSRPEDVRATMDAQDFLQNCFLDMSVFGRYPVSYINYLQSKGWYPKVQEQDKKYLMNYHPDFLGVNYYSSSCVRARTAEDFMGNLPPFYQNELFIPEKNPWVSQQYSWMESGVDPQGLYIGIRTLYERYHLPMIITENGFAYSDQLKEGKVEDDYRIQYLDAHIQQCQQLIMQGYPIFGYSTWSFLDLVSSHQGFGKRYGLVYVDRTDEDAKKCQRIPKASYYWYQKRIKKGMIMKNEK